MEINNYIPNFDQGRTYLDSSLLDSLSSLDILYANECETSSVPDDLATSTEVYFYRGGQVRWLNFYLSEQRAEHEGSAGSSFIKRDGYQSVAMQVDRQRQSHLSVSSVYVFHEPGSGGTTLAMQVLWNFRKSLRCAVLKDSKAEAQEIARQIIDLFQAGGPRNWNTVLLLIDNLPEEDTLQSSLVQCVASSQVDGNIPVVIILNCKRVISPDGRGGTDITCPMMLSICEQERFIEKEVVLQLHGQQREGLHGFNIMRHGFSEEYVKEAISPIMDGVQPAAKNTELLSVLALLNSYVPGSSLLKSECQAFLGPPDPIHGGPSFEDRMESFAGLLVTFPSRVNLVSHDFVRMAHPLIATYCCQKLQSADLTLYKMVMLLIEHFDKEQRQRPLPLAMNYLLVNRTTGKQFSPLIEDIRRTKPIDCVCILESVYRKYPHNAFVLQALARFLYLSPLQDYSEAEKRAQESKRIMPNNSFIADTLGQLHKHHLRKMRPDDLYMQLELVQKAVAAFEEQWNVAEQEEETGARDAEGLVRKSFFFNSSGLLGFMLVASLIATDMRMALPPQDAKEMALMLSAKGELPYGRITNKTLQRFETFLASFKDKVEKTFNFFEFFLTYSERDKDQPNMRENATSCYVTYIRMGTEFSEEGAGGSREELKKRTAASFPGLLYCLETTTVIQEIVLIVKKWKEVVPSPSSANLPDALCYLLSHIVLSCVDPESKDILPFTELTSILHELLLRKDHDQDHKSELYFLALVLLWPSNSGSTSSLDRAQQNPGADVPDLNNYVRRLQKAFEQSYHKHLRSRHLRPHFFLRDGTDYSRLVHRSTVKRWLINNAKDNMQGSRPFHQWRNQAVWENTQLLRVQGIIKDKVIFACCGKREIPVHPDNMAQVRSPGRVSFYLGFNIRGPVAFDIQYASGPGQPPL